MRALLAGAIVVALTVGVVRAGAAAPRPVDLGVGIAVVQGEVHAGDRISLRITVSRLTRAGGPLGELRLRLSETEGLVDVAYRPSSGVFARASGRWTKLRLTTARPVVLTVTGTVPDDAVRRTLVVEAAVAPPRGWIDRRLRNNAAKAARSVEEKPIDLALAVDDGRVTIEAGAETSYAITVTNHGPSVLTPQLKLDLFPGPLLRTERYASSEGAFDRPLKHWAGLTLAVGESATLILAGTIPSDSPAGKMTVGGCLSVPALYDDTVLANDCVFDETTIVRP